MAYVATYSLSRDGAKKLSANFSVREFRCKDGSDKILICQETVNILQAVRNYFGKPITINSAYRTPAHNKRVGGASSSQHVKGTACDIVVQGVPSWAVAAYLEANYPRHGIGLYANFVHIDSRGYGVYWKNKGNNVVKGFGYGTSYTKYKATTPTVTPTPKKQEEEVVTYADFKKFMNQYIAEVQAEAGAGWSKTDRDWAVKEGLFKGDKDGRFMWGSPVTREQLAAILHRMEN